MAEKYKQKKKLNRREWLQCLVQTAVMRYVLAGRADDVSTAVHSLLQDDLLPHLDPALSTAPNDTREAICYNEPVDTVLRRHEAALRLIFARTCELGGTSMSGGIANKLVSYANWKDFLKIFGLVDVCTRWPSLSHARQPSNSPPHASIHAEHICAHRASCSCSCPSSCTLAGRSERA